MADDADIACDLAQRDREGAVALLRQAAQGAGAEDCADCGAPIPAARRKAVPHATRCMPCQTRAEARERK